MSVLLVVPERLEHPASALAVASQQLTGVAHALRRQAVDTGRADSTGAVAALVRALAVTSEQLGLDVHDDARALRAGAELYRSTEQRLLVR